MKKTTSYLMLILCGMLASCNLFIDEEAEDLSNGLDLNKKTVYTGDGWSEPKTETGEGYNITYHYQDNVKLLTDEIQSYILNWEVEDLYGAIGIIDFRANTPERFLPRIGEVLTCRPSPTMPEGFYAEVMAAGFVDGVYRVGTCAVEMNDVFKVLEGEIDMTVGEEVEQEPSAAVRSDGSTQTRADDEGGTIEFQKAQRDFTLDGEDGAIIYQFKHPVAANLHGKMPKITNRKKQGAVVDSKGGVSKWSKSTLDGEGRVQSTAGGNGSLELRASETSITHRVKVKLSFENVMPALIISDTIVTSGVARIKGGIDCDKAAEKTIKAKSHKILYAGPVSIKLLVKIGMGVEANVFGTSNVHFSDSSVVAFKTYLLSPLAEQLGQFLSEKMTDLDAWLKQQSISVEDKGNRHIKGSMHVTEGTMEGKLALSFKLEVGASFGSSNIGNGIFLKHSFTGDGASFPVNGKGLLDIYDLPGLSTSSKTEVGVNLSLSLIGIMRGLVDGTLSKVTLGTKAYKYLIEQLKKRKILSEDVSSDLVTVNELVEVCREFLETVDESTEGTWLNYSLPPITMNAWSKSLDHEHWMPETKGFSYKLVSTTSEGANYYTSWTYRDKGMLVNRGFGPYYPCLYVDGGKDDKATGTYYPDINGSDETDPISSGTSIKNYGTGITVPKLKPGKSYTVYPAFSLGRDKPALFLDIGQTISVAATTVKVASVEPESSEQIAYKGGWMFEHIFSVKVAVKGAARVYEWAINLQIPTYSGKMVEFEKRVKKAEIKETRAHPVRIDVVSPLASFDIEVNGEYFVIESTADSPEGFSTSFHFMDPYPFTIGKSSARATGRNAARNLAPYNAARSERIGRYIEEYGTDIPVLFIDGDDEPAVPVAIIENGIRKPLKPMR